MASYDLGKDRFLMQRISSGDEPAFDEFFNLYRRPLYAFVLYFTKSKADAEEIIQETFMVIWQKRFEVDKIDNPANYIYTIARHKTYKFLKKVSRNEEMQRQIWENIQEENNSTEELVQSKETLSLITQALGELSEQKRRIFEMSRFEGKGHEEIAAEVGLSKSRVKNIIVEVLRHIRFHLREHSTIALLIFEAFLNS